MRACACARRVRVQFLERLEPWKREALEAGERLVRAKVEETQSEHELRVHLHEPRAARIERDVHHVRAAELKLHEERVRIRAHHSHQ